MEKCYGYFNCSKLDCIRRESEDKDCWEIDGTLCVTHCRIVDIMKDELESKILDCKACLYYKKNILKKNN